MKALLRMIKSKISKWNLRATLQELASGSSYALRH